MVPPAASPRSPLDSPLTKGTTYEEELKKRGEEHVIPNTTTVGIDESRIDQ